MADNTFNIVGNLLLKVDGAEAGLNKLKNSLSQLKMPANLDSSLKKSFSNLDGLFAKYKAQLKDGFNTKGDVTSFAKTGKQIEAEYDKISATISKLTGKEISFKTDLAAIHNTEKELEKLISLKEKLSQDIKGGLGLNDYLKAMQASDVGRKGTKVFDASNILQTSLGRGDIEKAKADVESLIAELNRMSEVRKKALEDRTGLSMIQIIDKIRNSVNNADTALNKYNSDIKKTSEETARLESGKFEKANEAILNAANSADKLTSGFKEINGGAQQAADSMFSMTKQVEQLQQSTQYFFSLRNMINLLKRGIDDAVQSVKELDKAMTETAVVTDYKVSDLWGMLPEYTKVANELGATTQGAYETMTLYYQQGLDQQQAFELGAETMKMARIAGLDYAETTDMMTAALRGFNMELNETSAKRVNDVYSELAAITASDTEELGTAMQRTASIAHSAGASFEGATAFLAQAIETTREPAENIGTAMKTIIARFQEMKKNPLEISEVDGEEVDYNKIDAALKTIGVDLKDTNGQFREWDKVMLDISAKWNTLSQSQQRYIATTAAGSRQQSRFIAMVSNYDRTMQLMEAANNSAGASDEQFGKTMDSLESKLNQLHNAWQAFTMGIANNNMIKLAVDGLTNFLTVTNTIIDKLSMGSGAIKSFLSIFAAFTGLKAAGRIANRAIGGLGGLIDPQSTFKEGFKGGAIRQGQNQAQAKAISTPIVNSLSKISGQIAAIAKTQGVKDAGQKGQSTTGTKETSKEDYKQIKQAFDKLSGKDGFKMSDASNLFKQLDEKHQRSMFNNSPGTKQAMKQASLNWFDAQKLSPELTKQGKQYISSIYKGMEQGQVPVHQGIRLIGRPDLWGEQFGTDTAKAISESFAQYTPSRASAEKGAWRALNMKGATQEAKEAYLKVAENRAQFEEIVNKNLDKGFQEQLIKNGGIAHGEAKGTVTDMGRFANDIGAVADKFTQAGYGITTFGNALSQLGGPLGAVGNGIAAFGGAISTIGASISGATGIISLFTVGITDATGAVVVAGSTIAAVAAPLAVLAAGFLLVRDHIKQVKEAGAEVTETFKETSKTAEDNVAKLKSYQSEFAQLSKGVDSNGYNVSLDDSQYQRYLEIVDDIAAINPEIVEGYNAQGHAIINNNEALAETLKKQQEIRDEAYKTYTEQSSLQKLINARNISSEYRNSIVNPTSSKAEDAGLINNKKTPFAADVRNIADLLDLSVGVKDFDFTKYGIDSLDALKNGEEKAVQNFVKHREQIEADLSNSGIKLSDAVIEGFDTLGDDVTAFDEAIKPVYDNLLANVSNSKVFESIAPEFRDALQTGLKDLASQDLDAPEMAKAANTMAARFANLTTGSGKYKDALDIVEQAQQNFASSLDETQYQADVQPAIDDLIRLKEEALDEGSAYGDALAEYLENQIEQISHFTEEGTISLSEALNTMQDDIAAAEGALSSFQESTKSDYSTAASGMKGIFEEIFKETDGKQLHTEGFGDQTFWKGAKELLSEDIVDAGNIDDVISKLNKIKPALEDGQDGWENFLDVVENTKGMDKWFKFFDDGTYQIDIPEEEFSEAAKQLGVSENFLTSMLNKGRQFANISFSNVESVREALATSNSAIKGQSIDANGNKSLYVKEDSIRTELFNQGYVTKDDQDRQLKAYLDKGIKTIPAADSKELTKDDWKNLASDWGVKNLPDLIQTLNDTGEFTKDEIKAYADKMDMLGSEGDFEKNYADIIAAAENPELARQTSELQSINAKVGALLDKRNPEEQKSAWKDFHDMIYGGKGVDTDFQHFARGENGSGGSLSSGEYETTKKNMQEAIQTAEEASQKYKFMADQSSGADKKHFDDLAKKYDADAQHIRELMTAGEKAYADAQSQIDRERQAAAARRKGKDQEREVQQKVSQSQAKANAQAANEKGKTLTNKIVNNTEENKTVHEKTVFETEGTEQLDEAKNKIDTLSIATSSPFALYLKANYPELADAYDKVVQVQDVAEQGTELTVGADMSAATKAQQSLMAIAKKTYTAKLKATESGLGGILSKLGSIASKIFSINNTTVKPKGASATGHNNYIASRSIPTFQSAAKGKGRVGPKNRGGLTLTGEEGYEIAWLPSEGKSMILGAVGPQMVNLPADAVVYTHEQSKDILKKQQTISAGSHAGEVSGTGTRKNNTISYSTASTSGSKKASNSTQKNKGNDKNTIPEEVTKLVNKAGTVLVWWENVARQIDAAQRKSQKTQKTLDKLLKTFGTSVGDYLKVGQTYKEQLNNIKTIAQDKITRANQELGYTNNGIAVNKTKAEANEQAAAKKELDAAKAKLKKAKKTKSKKDDKKAKKKVKTAQKAYDNTKGAQKDAEANSYAEAIGARQEISYEVTKTTTKKDKKGKKKTTTKTETKKESIDLAGYITTDANGVYILDEKAIAAEAAKNKSKAEAIKQAAEKQLNDLLSKRQAAEDELAKAQEEYEQFLNDTYDAFYAWDKSITEVYFLGKELEKLGELRSMYEAATDVEFAKLLSGVDYDKASNGLKNVLDALPGLGEALEKNRDYLMQQAQTNYAKMNAAYTEYINAITGADNLEKYRKAMGSDVGLSQNAKNEYEIWKATQEFLKDSGFVGSNFDISAAIDKFNRGRLGLEAKNWKGDDYEKIKQGLDKIAEKQADYYNAITETYSSITEIYGVIEEYQSYLSDFENSLIKGIEEEASKEIDQLSKINSSLSNAAKELLDEVKRKLDERRKQEDNAKTERDISQKQQRLAALQADTSGGHQVEIAQLQKEIAESQQGYSRTLEDQLLDRLSQQQDEAAKQRERQISLLESQRDLAIALGTNVEEVNKWLTDPKKYYEQIRTAWLAQQGYENAGAQERKQLEEQFVSEFTKFEAYGLALPGLMEAATSDIFSNVVETELPKSVSGIEQRLDSILGIIPTVEELANLPQLNVTPGSVNPSKLREAGYTVKEAIDYSKIQRGQAFSLGELYKGGYTAPELYKGGFTNAADYKTGGVSYADAKSAGFSNETLHKAGYQEGTAGWAQELDTFIQKSNQELIKLQQDYDSTNRWLSINQNWLANAQISLANERAAYAEEQKKAKAAAKKAKSKKKGNMVIAEFVGSPSTFGIDFAQSMVNMYQSTVNEYSTKVAQLQKQIKEKQNAITTATNKRAGLQFKTGGIADYTGPAWLDGTPSKPELVLNARDTQNFLVLRDVLSKAIGSTNSINNSYGGDNIFEINVNVDKIEKDYDVDRVIEKVKKEITKGAGYRNVTQVRNFR